MRKRIRVFKCLQRRKVKKEGGNSEAQVNVRVYQKLSKC